MEPRFGHDFARVRVHHDRAAATAARAVSARAFTLGPQVVFGAGQYRPATVSGRRLLAHELAHVVQGPAAFLPRSAAAGAGFEVGSKNDPQERDADRLADAVIGGAADTWLRLGHEPAGVVAGTGGGRRAGVIRRQPVDSPDESAAPAEPAMTRAEEIALSRESPGGIAGTASPLTISLYNFEIESAVLKSEHGTVLAEVGALLKRRVRAEMRVHAVGHTDSTGGEGFNLRLSRRRAAAVRDVLEPLVGRRVGIIAAGESQPTQAQSNETVAGRSRNRRVDLRFVYVRPPRQRVPDPSLTVEPPTGDDTPPPPPPPERKDDDDTSEDSESLCAAHPLLCAAVGVGVLGALACFLEPALCLPALPGWPVWPDWPGGNDDKPPEDPKKRRRSGPQVVFTPRVRAPNTPGGMNDRISNANPVRVTAVVIDPPALDLPPIHIDVSGGVPAAGNATLDGAATLDIRQTTSFDVLGSVLTNPAFSRSPFLQLGAWYAGDLVGHSNRFAVSAIVENWQVAFSEANEFPGSLDMDVNMSWQGDGVGRWNLAPCHYWELVGVDAERGGMAGMGIGAVQGEDDFGMGDITTAVDIHGTERRWLRQPGFQRLNQVWRIRDTASNSTWVPSTNSGFQIERTFERDPGNPSCWRLVIDKFGAPASVGGVLTGAGAGRARHVFRDVNCDPTPQPAPRGGDSPAAPAGPTTADATGPTTSDADTRRTIVRVVPRPGTLPANTTSHSAAYVSGLPSRPVPGQVYPIEMGFVSKDVYCIATVPFRVLPYDAADRTAPIRLEAAVVTTVNVAPPGHPPRYVTPGLASQVPRSQLPPP
jgi:outer membrane protein OmpA-like peptidoglycan-associated protein